MGREPVLPQYRRRAGPCRCHQGLRAGRRGQGHPAAGAAGLAAAAGHAVVQPDGLLPVHLQAKPAVGAGQLFQHQRCGRPGCGVHHRARLPHPARAGRAPVRLGTVGRGRALAHIRRHRNRALPAALPRQEPERRDLAVPHAAIPGEVLRRHQPHRRQLLHPGARCQRRGRSQLQGRHSDAGGRGRLAHRLARQGTAGAAFRDLLRGAHLPRQLAVAAR
ncbi:hypothetical protein D3C81_1212270 [compost metagenome]